MKKISIIYWSNGGNVEVLANAIKEGAEELGAIVNIKLVSEANMSDVIEADAVALWRRVLELDENNELANTGIGKAYLTAGDYKLAMKYLKLGMKRDYYSIAYKRYRNSVLRENANYFLTGIVILIVSWKGVKTIRIKRKGENRNG